MRTQLDPVRCVPSCEDGDGHPHAVFVDDQTCFGPSWSVPLSQEEVERSGERVHVPFVEVCTRRRPGAEPSIHLHASMIRDDVGFDLTEPEALRLVSSLTAVIALVRADAEAVR